MVQDNGQGCTLIVAETFGQENPVVLSTSLACLTGQVYARLHFPCAGVLSAMSLRSIDDLAALLGPESEAVTDLKRLFDLAAGYG
jgi:hypothetical protein